MLRECTPNRATQCIHFCGLVWFGLVCGSFLVVDFPMYKKKSINVMFNYCSFLFFFSCTVLYFSDVLTAKVAACVEAQ